MGDRCYLQITLRREDLDRFGEAGGLGPDWWDEELDEPAEGIVEVAVCEANYACIDAREAAAEARVPFFGAHDAGDEYAGCAFASVDGEHVEVYTDPDGLICAQLDEEMRLLTGLEYIRAYLDRLAAVRRLFGLRVREPEPDTVDTEAERIGEHYLLHIVGDVEPDLHGPYPTEAVRDETARRIRLGSGDRDGLYRLDMTADGMPVVRPYRSMELAEDAA